MHGARPARSGDADELIRLLKLSIAATSLERGGGWFGYPERQIDAEERVRASMKEPGTLVLAGTIEDVVVGMAIATHGHGTPVVVQELYVEPPAREVGVGEALLDAVVDWARQEGAPSIDYPVLPGDRATKNLGERSGFSARVIVMHRRL